MHVAQIDSKYWSNMQDPLASQSSCIGGDILSD
jgi:hypothetical protein